MSRVVSTRFDAVRNALVALLDGSGGTKVVDLASTQVPYVGVNPDVGGSSPFQLLVGSNRVQALNPAADITVKLPTAGIKAGDRIRIVNRATAFLVTVQSSGANAIDTLAQGFIELIAVTNTPTAAADWFVVAYYATASNTTTTWSFSNGGSGTSGTASTYRIARNGKQTTINFDDPNAWAVTGTPSDIVNTTDVPSWATPAVETRVGAEINNNGVFEMGQAIVQINGNILLRRGAEGNFTGTSGFRGAISLTYIH